MVHAKLLNEANMHVHEHTSHDTPTHAANASASTARIAPIDAHAAVESNSSDHTATIAHTLHTALAASKDSHSSAQASRTGVHNLNLSSSRAIRTGNANSTRSPSAAHTFDAKHNFTIARAGTHSPSSAKTAAAIPYKSSMATMVRTTPLKSIRFDIANASTYTNTARNVTSARAAAAAAAAAVSSSSAGRRASSSPRQWSAPSLGGMTRVQESSRLARSAAAAMAEHARQDALLARARTNASASATPLRATTTPPHLPALRSLSKSAEQQPHSGSNSHARSLADVEWNEGHTGALQTSAVKKKKHVFSLKNKGCAEENTDRLEDPKSVLTDNWVGGFYTEVFVDGWDIDKTVTIDFHTSDIEFPKHACQNVRVVGYTETTVTLALIQQRYICCEQFGCALNGERPQEMTYTCGKLASPPPSPPPLPSPPPPPSPPQPRPPPPPFEPPPPWQAHPPSPPPPPFFHIGEGGVVISSPQDKLAALSRGLPPPPPQLVRVVVAETDAWTPQMLVLAGGCGVTIILGVLYVLRKILTTPGLMGGGHHVLPIAQAAGGAAPRAKAKSATVVVTKGGKKIGKVTIGTKHVNSVAEFGEAVADALRESLDLDEPFKLFYADDEADVILVNAHTEVRDLLSSPSISAKIEAERERERSRSDRKKDKSGGSKSKKNGRTRVVTDDLE